MKSLRLFIAVEMSPEIRWALAELWETLAGLTSPKSVRWVPAENIHLTLKFLGDTDPARVESVASCLNEIGAMHQPFDLALGKLSCFPNPRKPRVIWVGVEGDVGQLATLQSDVESRLTSLGWEADGRRYHPHLTLGRVKDTREVVEARLPWGLQRAQAEFAVTELHLIQSDLRPEGAVYTLCHAVMLGRPATRTV